MTSTRDGWDADFGTRAADSAECLLVVGGYRDHADALCRVVDAAKERILMSPSLGDFFELRFVDIGPRPSRAIPAGGSAGVARLALELTSRPGEAARNFSAIMVIDWSAAAVDRVLRDCQADRLLSALKVRFHGIASTDDRSRATPGKDQGTGPEITIAPDGGRAFEEVVTGICRYAEDLLGDFGSGREPGLPAERLNELGAKAGPELRGVVEAAAEADVAARLEARRAELDREAERNKEAELRRELRRREAQLREAQLREAQLREAERSRKAEIAAEREARHADEPREAARPPSGNAHEERSANTAEPGSRRAEDGSPAEAARTVPEAKRAWFLPRRPEALETGANLLARFLRRPEPETAGRGDSGTGVTVLLECIAQLRAGDRKGFKAYLSALRTYTDTDAEIGAEERRRYRVVIIEDRLLRPGLPLGSMDVQFYDVLLRLAYGLPLGYAAYCEVEDQAMAGQPPQAPLLEAISGGGTADVRVTAITRYHLGEERLTDWFRSGQVNAAQLISTLPGEWDRPRHADLLYDVTLRYLSVMRGRYDQQAVTDALRAHGYLAAALRERYPRSMQDQVTVLLAFLRAAYPAGLDRRAVADVLATSRLTRALLEAVLRALPDPADREWAVGLLAERLGEKGHEEALLKLLTPGRDGGRPVREGA